MRLIFCGMARDPLKELISFLNISKEKAIKFNTELFHLDIREKLSARIVKGLVSGKKLITLELRTEI